MLKENIQSILFLILLLGFATWVGFRRSASPKLDDGFNNFVSKSIEHGIYSISDNEGPLVPFVVTQIAGKKNINRFVNESYENAVLDAEEFVKKINMKEGYVAFVYDGYVTLNEQKTTAVLAKVFDVKQSIGFIYAQRYKPKSDSIGFEPDGPMISLTKISNLLN